MVLEVSALLCTSTAGLVAAEFAAFVERTVELGLVSDVATETSLAVFAVVCCVFGLTLESPTFAVPWATVVSLVTSIFVSVTDTASAVVYAVLTGEVTGWTVASGLCAQLSDTQSPVMVCVSVTVHSVTVV